MDMHRKQGNSSNNERELLTSSAWNAFLLHRPVDADSSTTAELPSTVDMDAIKAVDQSAQTTTSTTTWPIASQKMVSRGASDDDDSEDDSDEDDSDGDSRSSSGSDSDDSGSNSCSMSSSHSSSRSSSCSSVSAPSRTASPAATFSVSKPNFDQGGLKLKIALKVNSGKGSGTESDSLSSHSQESLSLKKNLKSVSKNLNSGNTTSKKTIAKVGDGKLKMQPRDVGQTAQRFSNPLTKAKLDAKYQQSKSLVIDKSPTIFKTPASREIKSSSTVKSTVKKTASVAKSVCKPVNGKNRPAVVKRTDIPKKENAMVVKKSSLEVSRLRSFRRKTTVSAQSHTNSQNGSKGLASNGGRYLRSSPAQTKNSSVSDSSESEEESPPPTRKSRGDEVSEITEIEKELGHISSTEPALPTMSEHLQVINQEDLAAILPDVITTETHEGFDVFEDVASESGKTEKKDGPGQDSGSDVELPDQVVSEAIKRIHSDSEDVDNSESDKDVAKTNSQRTAQCRNSRASESSSSDENSERTPSGYSSSLLQQFVEKTELLSAQCERILVTSSRVKSSSRSSNYPIGKRRKSDTEGTGSHDTTKKMPELEASYRLDCSSNVSPDSGIHSVPGSPLNEVSHRDPTPPVLRPVSPPDKYPSKKTRGRPKKKSIDDCRILEKKGPGRPKKIPPVLEPNPPLPLRMLSEICDKVNKRLDTPNKFSRDIQIKELERIISDHKSGKNKSKFDGLFSKSKKLPNFSNVAIVKPMQHLVKEGEDDDEKQYKRNNKRMRKDFDEKLDELCKVVMVPDPFKFDKKKIERDKKIPASSSQTNPLPRSRLRHLSSCTEGSRDKSIGCERMKSKKRKIKKHLSKKSAINYVQPMLRKVVHKKSRINLRHSLLHHKQKRKKEKRSVLKKDRRNPSREWFVEELEKLIVDFQKFGIDGSKKVSVPGIPVASSDIIWKFPLKPDKLDKPIKAFEKLHKIDSTVLLTKVEKSDGIAATSEIVDKVVVVEPRTRRAAKKRKVRDVERSRESKPCSDKESGAEEPAFPVLSTQVGNHFGSQIARDREKDKPKRKQKKNHLEVVKGKDSKETNPNEQRLPLKKRHYHLSSSSQLSPMANKTPSEPVEIENKPDNSSLASSIETTSDGQRNSRNSIDEAIEATINRFASVSPSLSNASSSITDSPGVIVTPKKRHKVEDDVLEESGQASATALVGREGSIKIAGTVEGKRRSGLRCPSKDLVRPEKLKKSSDKIKSTGKIDRSHVKNVEKIQTRSSTKPPELTIEDSSKTEPLHIILPELDKIKSEAPVSDSVINLPSTEIKTESGQRLLMKQPAAGIFEPSETPVTIDSSVLKPLTSPSEIVHLKGSILINRRKGRTSPATSIDHKLLLKKAEEVKKKVRRRHRNRTGFPSIKKKKRKTMDPFDETKTVQNLAVIDSVEQQLSVGLLKKESIGGVFIHKRLIEGDIDLESDTLEDGGELSESSLSDVPLVKVSEKISSTAKKRRLLPHEVKNIKSEINVGGNPVLKRKRKLESTVRKYGFKSKNRNFLAVSEKKYLKSSKEFFGISEESACESTEIAPESTRKRIQPRWKKKYLTAGIFSDHFKHPDCESALVAKPSEKNLHKLTYDPSEHEFGLLPPPPYCNNYIRLRREDFQIPYDIWWQHVNNKLPGRNNVPSWNYKKIRTNVYYDVKPQTGTGSMNEVQACNCRLPPPGSTEIACGEDCINRLVFAECSPQLCPCKDKCSNQRIQRHRIAPGLTRFMTQNKGWGIKTTKPIKTGDFILEYVGEVVSENEFKERMGTRYANDTHHYCLHLDGGLVIDGHRMGGDGRFVNHSCEPNCEMQKWTVNGLFRMALFALRNIEPNEELTYDYNFSLFNPVEGQVCLCGTTKCRGVIGGKSQRVAVPGKSTQLVEKKDKRLARKPGRARKKHETDNSSNTSTSTNSSRLDVLIPIKPMSQQQRIFAQQHRCFLLRNLEKITRNRASCSNMGVFSNASGANDFKTNVAMTSAANSTVAASSTASKSDVFYTRMNALSTLRSIKTRKLTQAEVDPEVDKIAKLACILKQLYQVVATAKDEKGGLFSTPFMTLPKKSKVPQYYTRISDPIDLTTIEQNINSGKYRTIKAFDDDLKKLFANNVRFYGRTSDLGIAATRLKRAYNLEKINVSKQLEDVLGESLPATFLPVTADPGAEEEDVIRCLCGLFKDEGVMIQCERCLVWQHCDCVKADDSWEHYLCERCEPRDVSYEIVMEPQPEYAEDDCTYYISLMRGEVQFKLGDAVYVLRDMVEEGINPGSPPRKVTYKTIKNVNYADLDIFRIERLWINNKGEKFAFGHHFLRPHETYHEPTRKFFINEVMRIPLYEVVPLDLIMQHCWVLDLSTFCKGRPVGAPENHIYICEYRVDRTAHLFTKIAKPYPICTKNYAFERFDVRLKPARSYTPHGEIAASVVGRSNRSNSTRSSTSSSGASHHQHGNGGGRNYSAGGGSKAGAAANANAHTNATAAECSSDDELLPLARVRDHAHKAKKEMQKKRLNAILLKLLGRQPCKNPIDASYLVEPVKRSRSKKIST